jgi:hypothetical protein
MIDGMCNMTGADVQPETPDSQKSEGMGGGQNRGSNDQMLSA